MSTFMMASLVKVSSYVSSIDVNILHLQRCNEQKEQLDVHDKHFGMENVTINDSV